MGFISKLIPSVIAGGIGFWVLSMLFESIYIQAIGSLVILIIMYCILSIPSKKSTAKDEPQKQKEK